MCTPVSVYRWRALSLPHLALAVCLVLAACGGRSIGAPGSDGQLPPGPDGGPQPDYDGWVPPDTVGCFPPPWQTAILTPGEPCFVHSLDRITGGNYVLAYSQGWSTQSARLRMLDKSTLAEVGHLNVDAETIHARFDQWSGEIVALAQSNNEVRYLRFRVIAGRNLELLDDVFLCDDCEPAWGGPETVEAYAGAAVREFTNSWIRVFVFPQDAPWDVLSSAPVVGSSPELVDVDEDLVLLYLQDQQLWQRSVSRYAELGAPFQRTITPTRAFLGASSYGNNTVAAAVVTASDANPELEVLRWTGQTTERVRLPAPLGTAYANEGGVSFSPSTIGVTWGVTVGDVGTHFMGTRSLIFDTIFPPTRISTPTGQSSSTYTVWSATAHHPTGHAVVWGGWHDGQYGVFGKIIPCNGGL